MVAPPFEGAVQERATCALPPVALGLVGALGTVTGVHVPLVVNVQIVLLPDVVFVPPVAVIFSLVGAEMMTTPEPP